MKKRRWKNGSAVPVLSALAFLTCVTLTGCASGVKNEAADKQAQITGRGDLSLIDGADTYRKKGDHPHTPYYAAENFYNMESSKSLTLLPKFRTYQQSGKHSGGLAAALMVMDYYGDERTETELKGLCRDHSAMHGGSCLIQLMDIFDSQENYTYECTYDYLDGTEQINLSMIREYLQNGTPVIAANPSHANNWEVIIGYDDMGTDSAEDDVLITANPYDTTDHHQDGYSVRSASEFFYGFSMDSGYTREDLNGRLFLAAKRQEHSDLVSIDEFNKIMRRSDPESALGTEESYKIERYSYYDSEPDMYEVRYLSPGADGRVNLICQWPEDEYFDSEYYLDGSAFRYGGGTDTLRQVLYYEKGYEESLSDAMKTFRWTDVGEHPGEIRIIRTATKNGQKFFIERPAVNSDLEDNWPEFGAGDTLFMRFILDDKDRLIFRDVSWKKRGGKVLKPYLADIYHYGEEPELPTQLRWLNYRDDTVHITLKGGIGYEEFPTVEYDVPRGISLYLSSSYYFYTAPDLDMDRMVFNDFTADEDMILYLEPGYSDGYYDYYDDDYPVRESFKEGNLFMRTGGV